MTATLALNAQTAMLVERAVEVLGGRRVAVLTGAGVSTDSGIPDYRGEGAPVRTPMTVDRFLESDAARRRYWVGSQLGWRAFSSADPNSGHEALARLENDGVVTGVITQNVDGLHLRAGTRRLVELHGTMRRIQCLRCGQIFDRRDVSARIDADNPWLARDGEIVLGPDGDVTPESVEDFVLPLCTVCGGTLKPDVVFFGEFIPAGKFKEAEQLVHASEALVVAGSSLVVNSGVRLVERARRRRMPIVVVNRGVTRADPWAAVKIDAGTTEVLSALSDRLPAAR
jgi:NAD-dependent SIR2 family protein deacetylase